MYTDLFLALIDEANPRGHPILAGLLYAFCPSAARWWKEGVKPDVPFDLLWQMLLDRQAGRSLQDVLKEYGFETLLEEVKSYIEMVRVFRSHHFGTAAPETLPVFRTVTIEPKKRFNLSAAIRKLDGNWDHLLEYARLWAFVYPDWVRAFNMTTVPNFRAVRLAFAFPETTPVYFPAWTWEANAVKNRAAKSRVLWGLIVNRKQDHDQLRLLLAEMVAQRNDEPVEVWTLVAETGQAEPFDPKIPFEDLRTHLMGLAALAKQGPYPPLNAYQNPGRCRQCAFQRECYEGGQGHGLARRKLSARVLREERDA